jgi:hypothetical protein
MLVIPEEIEILAGGVPAQRVPPVVLSNGPFQQGSVTPRQRGGCILQPLYDIVHRLQIPIELVQRRRIFL